MAYLAITDSQIEPDAPLTSALMAQMRDNPEARFTEGVNYTNAVVGGASGTKVQDAALSTTATTAGSTWVKDRQALAGVGEVGTFAMLSVQEFPFVVDTWTPGRYVTGIALKYASVSGAIGTAASGNWRCMGYAQTGPIATFPATDTRRVTLWLRVS